MAIGTPATALLNSLGIAFTIHEYAHEPSAESFGLEAAEKLGFDPAQVFKTLIVDVDAIATVAIVPVSAHLSLKSLARACAGKKAVMADPVVAARLTGYVVGGISPIGQKKKLRTVLDETAGLFDTILVSGGHRGLDIELAPDALLEACDAHYADIADFN